MANKKVLVTDDDPVVRVLVTEFLTSNGYEVETLSSGTACLDKLEHEKLPDVLVLDLLMPDMSGIEVLKQIRSNPAMNQLPIVMLSADPENEAMLEGAAMADTYLQKPFGVRDILTAILGVIPIG